MLLELKLLESNANMIWESGENEQKYVKNACLHQQLHWKKIIKIENY